MSAGLFRTVEGFERLETRDDDYWAIRCSREGLYPQYDRSDGSFVTNSSSYEGEIVDTNIEAYEGVIAVLGLKGVAPAYRDAITAEHMNVQLDEDDGFTRFGTATFTTPGGLDSRFYMTPRGWIGDDRLYYLGVEASRPHEQNVSLYPQPTHHQYIAALREPPLGVPLSFVQT